MSQLTQMPQPSDLPKHAYEILAILQQTEEWMSRSDLALRLGKSRLTPHEIHLLERLTANGQVELSTRENLSPVKYEWVYRAGQSGNVSGTQSIEHRKDRKMTNIPMTVIAIANRKGGTGKTTIASHLAGALAHRGNTVCLIDTDPQGNVSIAFGRRPEPGLFNLVVENADFQDILRLVETERISTPDSPVTGQLYILPSDERTQAIPVMDKNPFSLANRLEELEDVFDYIIIDTAPTLSMFDGTVYLACHGILYVTECETLSLEGIKQGIKQLTSFAPQRLKNSLPEIKVLGIVPNKFREKTAAHVASLKAVQAKFGELVWEPITLRTVLPEAMTSGKLVFSYAPTSDAARSMWNIADKVQEEIAVWQKE